MQRRSQVNYAPVTVIITSLVILGRAVDRGAVDQSRTVRDVAETLGERGDPRSADWSARRALPYEIASSIRRRKRG
jgi:hypothetical protein